MFAPERGLIPDANKGPPKARDKANDNDEQEERGGGGGRTQAKELSHSGILEGSGRERERCLMRGGESQRSLQHSFSPLSPSARRKERGGIPLLAPSFFWNGTTFCPECATCVDN